MSNFSRSFLLLLCLFALGLTAGCGQKAGEGQKAGGRVAATATKQAVEVVQVIRRDLVESLSLVGSMAANETAQIRAEISGKVRAVHFNEGEPVKSGQLLLQIDDAELRAQLAQAEATYRLAELNLRRTEDLTQARFISQAEADRVRSEFSSAEAGLQLLRVRIAKQEIKAPFDGIASARMVSPGDYVTAATAITTIDDLSRLKVDFQVPERYAQQVNPGSTFIVRVRTPGGETQVDGQVYFTSSVIDRATRSVQVKGYVAVAEPGLRPGMFVNIDLVLQVHRGVLTVPEGAILSTASGSSVILVKQDKAGAVAEMVPVKLGLRSRGLVEIMPVTGEFGDGQQVVASGVGGLNIFPGTQLEPRPLKEEFRLKE